MAKNECSSTGEGRHQTVLVSDCVNATVESGDMVVMGPSGLHGVAFTDQVRGKCTFDIGGRWYLPVESGATIGVGDPVYVDVANQTIDNDPNHGWFFGIALEDVTTASTGDTICVLVVQAYPVPGSSLNAMHVTDIDDDNPIGGLPILFTIAVPNEDSTTEVAVAMEHDVRIIDAWLVKTGAAAETNGTTNTIEVRDDSDNAISTAMEMDNIGRGEVVRTALVDDRYWELDAGEELKVLNTKDNNSDNNECTVYVLAHRV